MNIRPSVLPRPVAPPQFGALPKGLELPQAPSDELRACHDRFIALKQAVENKKEPVSLKPLMEFVATAQTYLDQQEGKNEGTEKAEAISTAWSETLGRIGVRSEATTLLTELLQTLQDDERTYSEYLAKPVIAQLEYLHRKSKEGMLTNLGWKSDKKSST